MRVLVTGVGGFVGSYLAKHLSVDHAVVGNYRTANDTIMDLRDDGLLLVQCDLVHTLELDGPYDAIVHAAAAAGPWCSLDQIIADNIMAMQALVTAAKEWKVKAFIFMSSISTYGRIDWPFVEENTTRIAPDAYGMSKTFGEQLLKAHGIPSLSLRLPGILGPGANLRNWLPSVAKRIVQRERITAYNLEGPYNNAVHVADLAELIANVLEKPFYQSDEIVLGAGGTLTVREAIERLARELGLPLYLEESAESRPSFYINSALARHLWKYCPMHIAEMISRYATEVQL